MHLRILLSQEIISHVEHVPWGTHGNEEHILWDAFSTFVYVI